MNHFRIFLWPALFWYLLFVLAPVLWILLLSFQTRGTYGGFVWQATLENYLNLLNPDYLKIFGRSFVLAGTTGVMTVVLALLVAWALVSMSPRRRSLGLALVVLPFLINLIIRMYALRTFVGYDGPLQWLLRQLAVPFDPFAFTASSFLTYFGMVTTYLPFAILPIYGALERFDFSIFEAAEDLGAGASRAFLSVVVPNLKLPLLNAFLLVFIPALGEYVIPDLLGGARTMYLGNLLTEQFLKARNWPAGSALAIALMALMGLSLYLVGQAQKSVQKRKKPS